MIGSSKPHSLRDFSVLPSSYPQEEDITISAPISFNLFSTLTFSELINPLPFSKKGIEDRQPSMSKEDETFIVSPRTAYGRF